MMRSIRRVLTLIFLAMLMGALAEACGVETTFRAYLEKGFWRPFYRYVSELTKGLPRERKIDDAYAGMAATGGSPALRNVRQAYQNMVLHLRRFPPFIFTDSELAPLRAALRDARPGNVAETHELDLLRCKAELRAAKLEDDAGLQRTQLCFEAYLKQRRPASWTSEARGWLARTYFLRGLRAKAAKIYLDELKSPASNVSRQALLNSLGSLYPREHRPELLKNDWEEYLDTPAHALFVAELITNPNSWEMENPHPARTINVLTAGLIARLENDQSLFQRGSDGEALALTLMRAATRAGAPTSTLRYSKLLPEASVVRDTPEYNWLVGAALFQQDDYSGAETHFLKIVQSKASDLRHKEFALNALIGVYARVNRPVDQLWAAFQSAVLASDPDWEHRVEMSSAGLTGWQNLDVAYLLDVQLTDSELQEYLDRFADNRKRLATVYPRERTPGELVRYALAVRHARREEYAEAAQIYQSLQASPRAQRMRAAERLAAAARDKSLPIERQLQAQYDYAVFLADNSDGVFFNDSVWGGVQTWTFQVDAAQKDLYGNPIPADLSRQAAMTPEERSRFQQLERKIRDEQEEYWRAYQILNDVVQRAGHTPLGRKAAEKAVFCLRKIAVYRFGRAQEIRAGDIQLTNWLRNDKQ